MVAKGVCVCVYVCVCVCTGAGAAVLFLLVFCMFYSFEVLANVFNVLFDSPSEGWSNTRSF